jgi:hypothetical protein
LSSSNGFPGFHHIVNVLQHIVIGTPGRLKKLANDGILKLDSLKHFVLDECDQVLDAEGTSLPRRFALSVTSMRRPTGAFLRGHLGAMNTSGVVVPKPSE